jgi:hypothetical protein
VQQTAPSKPAAWKLCSQALLLLLLLVLACMMAQRC